MIDLAAAAEQLGVTEEALITAMGEPGQGEPDFDAAGAALGISAEELEAALMNSSGAPEGDLPQDGAPPEESSDSSEMPADSAETAGTFTLNETGKAFAITAAAKTSTVRPLA